LWYALSAESLTERYAAITTKRMARALSEERWGAGGELVEIGPNRFEYKAAAMPGDL
jgi:hypothetical protein